MKFRKKEERGLPRATAMSGGAQVTVIRKG